MDILDDLENIDEIGDDQLFAMLDKLEAENKISLDDDKSSTGDVICNNCHTEDYLAIDNANGVVVCTQCGAVMTEIFDNNPEWKSYDGNNASARCNGANNAFLPRSSLGTSISGSNRNRVKVLHMWNAMPYKERSLNVELKEIQNICRDAGIVKCIEDDTKILYKIISESKHLYGKNQGKYIIIRGDKRKGLKGACLYFACKRKGDTRSPKEIAKLFGIKDKDIRKGCKTCKKLLQLNQIPYDPNTNNPEHFIKRYCRELHLDKEYTAEILRIIKNIEKLDLVSCHTPQTVAIAGIILIIELNNIDIDRKVLETKFEVSGVTLEKAYKKIEKYKDIITNDDLTNKIQIMLNKEKQNIQVPEKLKTIYNKVSTNNNLKLYEYDPKDDLQLIRSIDAIEEEGKKLLRKPSC
ncbi:transcription initiation factor IIB [Klosneuvirus KNV1]|uniref:Transcription initiation factor IIB n=1 Tax=Klosneuvirus KNV1 TaxID=1977640 RepID=A0A1V0SI17_9VIRU|nr:transcription initiation factor IIB [Klosneuvirus KNV1]